MTAPPCGYHAYIYAPSYGATVTSFEKYLITNRRWFRHLFTIFFILILFKMKADYLNLIEKSYLNITKFQDRTIEYINIYNMMNKT